MVSTILEEARELTDGPRQDDYGDMKSFFTALATVWTAGLRDKLKDGASIDPSQTASMMVGFKYLREMHNHSPEHCRDMAGYCRGASVAAGDEAPR